MLTVQTSPAVLSAPLLPAHAMNVAESAENRLRCNSYLALKNICCKYQDGVLTLRGCLPSYYLKQVAQTAVAHLDGVRRVVNEIVVTPAPARSTRN